MHWFHTPKYKQGYVFKFDNSLVAVRLLYMCTGLVLFVVYFIERLAFGWLDIFAFIWLPAMLIASVR